MRHDIPVGRPPRLSRLAQPARNAEMYEVWRALHGETATTARLFEVSRATVWRAVRRKGRTLPGGWGVKSKGKHRSQQA